MNPLVGQLFRKRVGVARMLPRLRPRNYGLTCLMLWVTREVAMASLTNVGCRGPRYGMNFAYVFVVSR